MTLPVSAYMRLKDILAEIREHVGESEKDNNAVIFIESMVATGVERIASIL